MRARNTRPRLRGAVAAAWGILLLAGCGDAVPEDRTINVAPSGNRAAFQHGADGIFVADPQSGELRKVFDPDKSIVAVSSPLWLPDETQALFTTARDEPAPNDNRLKSVDRGRTAAAVDWNDAPEGRLFYPLPIVYTCWLLERGPDGGFKQPTALFEAHCGHTGYVAANCAVRRSARGDKILYIDHEPPTGHAVWTFDRKTGQKTRVFPPGGVSAPDYVVADYLPDGASIVCTAGRYGSAVVRDSGASEEEKVPPSASDKLDGIWIRPPDSDRWWHVAESQVRPEENGPGGLSGALARRPVFTKDGARLAFVRIRFDAGKPTALLFRGKISEHKVEQIFKTDQGISDPHWSPTGSRLGFVTMGPEPTLTVIDAQGQLERPAPGEFVRSFLGWNAAGNELAYVVAEHTSQPTVKTWSELLSVDPLARDALVVSATPRDVKDRDVKGSDVKGGDAKSGVAGSGQPRILLSGMRLTFPQWSPARDTISVWGTFTPTHRSWADTAVAHGLAMRAGDPAAAIDAASGSVRWLAINGDEQAQVGHAFQIKRDFAGALEWYRRAEKTLPKLQPFEPSELLQGVSGNVTRRRLFEFLYWHCLTKSGADREAAEHLHGFEQAYHIQWPASGTAARTTPEEITHELSDPLTRQQTERLTSVIRALAEAQAFLSVNDLDGGIEFFQHKLAAVTPHDGARSAERLGDLIALSQLDQLAGRSADYLELVTTELGPALATDLEDRRNVQASNTIDRVVGALADAAGRALVPLFQPEFYRGLPPDQVSRAITKWQALRPQCNSQSAHLIVDYALWGMIPASRQSERAAVNERIVKNPERPRFDWVNSRIRVLP